MLLTPTPIIAIPNTRNPPLPILLLYYIVTYANEFSWNLISYNFSHYQLGHYMLDFHMRIYNFCLNISKLEVWNNVVLPGSLPQDHACTTEHPIFQLSYVQGV